MLCSITWQVVLQLFFKKGEKKKEIKGNKDGYFIKHNIMKFMLKNTLASF